MKTKTASTKRNRPMLAVTIDPKILSWLKRGAIQSRRTLSSFVESTLSHAYEARHSDRKRAATA